MTKRSATGRPEISAVFREVWDDQIDGLNEQCTICQKFNQLITCNVYVPVIYDSEAKLINTCLCCAVPAVLDVEERDFDEDVIIEFSGGSRK